MLIDKFAIASEGCVPAPAKASRSSMTELTQFVYSPCGNSEGMVYSLGSGVIGQILNEKSYACPIFLFYWSIGKEYKLCLSDPLMCWLMHIISVLFINH